MAIRKKGLGKGLDSMFPSYTQKPQETVESVEKPKTVKKPQDKSATVKTKPSEKKQQPKEENKEISVGGVVMLKITEVEPNRQQPRKTFNEDTLQELSESIRQYGVIQPLLVTKKEGYFEIIAGERRWRAAKMAGVKEVPVIIKEYTKQQIMEISLIENIQRDDLNPIEEAEAYKRLLDEFQMKQDELAEKVSKSRTAITNAMRLLKLDERVKQMLIDEMLSTGHARTLLGLQDKDLQYELAQRIFEEKLSVREVERIVKNLQNPPKEKNEEETGDDTFALICKDMEDRMKNILGTKVSVNRKNEKKGKIEIEYYSNEDLERIFDLLRSIPIH